MTATITIQTRNKKGYKAVREIIKFLVNEWPDEIRDKSIVIKGREE